MVRELAGGQWGAQLEAAHVLLEALCCAPTRRNHNSSRAALVTNVHLDAGDRAAAVTLDVKLLLKTRVTNVPEGEGAFHMLRAVAALAKKCGVPLSGDKT